MHHHTGTQCIDVPVQFVNCCTVLLDNRIYMYIDLVLFQTTVELECWTLYEYIHTPTLTTHTHTLAHAYEINIYFLSVLIGGSTCTIHVYI